MKILIYGAGVIGSIFAEKLSQKGYDITILARGNRYNEIYEKGIILKNCLNDKTDYIKIKLVDKLEKDDIYDYIIIPVQNNQIDNILPILEKNKSQNFVFMVNNPLGYEKWIKAVGYNRIIIGFPSVGGERKDGVINYFISKGMPRAYQSTTFGELNGKKTERLIKLYKVFKKSGLSPSINSKMDWWQKTHVAIILPIGKALYRYESNNYELSKSYKTIKNMIYGIRELFAILESNGVKITPMKLKLYYLPVILIGKMWQKILGTKMAEYAMAKHTIVAKKEMEELEKQFMSMNEKGIELKYYYNI